MSLTSVILTPPYKLQFTKGFFTDLVQIARVLAYAVEHQDEGRILPAPTG